MALKRMDNVLVVVEDIDAAIEFFVELGMELEGRTAIEGRWADRVIGIDGARSEIAMMRVPNGNGRLELTTFHSPAPIRSEPADAPVNALGIRRLMFAVDDLDEVLPRLRARGAELVGEVVRFEDVYLLCYVRGPEGIMIGLAEELG
ncbi:VOC family protein [Saccharopolyspora griseoalba]|uniref:VOC family protein n=1 Tax=Saccharopolyspora griseoalba TaxID=1431848 RepID=A0ABW2LGN5_9PSEU